MTHPEERSFAIAKPPKVRMAAFSFVGQEEPNADWFQRGLVEG
jgi:hypothetical protein